MKLFSRLSGDDIFISYSRSDGSLYAAGLADALTAKGFSCFIDRYGVRPGHDLPADLVEKIRSCTVLVIVGTKSAAESEFVQKEINIFTQTGRVILPIDFEDSIGRALWYEDIPGLAAETERSLSALQTGNPSENVINFIEKSFNYTRRNQHMVLMFRAAAAAFIILITLGLAGFLFANRQARRARAETTKSEVELASAVRDKRRAERDAAAASAEGKREKARADSESDRRTRLTILADEKTKELNEATKLEEDQVQKATDADERKKAAIQNAAQQGERAKVSLAENYYNIAEAEAKNDPIRALPWLEKAIETTAISDGRFELYKVRALQGTRFSNSAVINTGLPGTDISNTTFSPNLDRVLFKTDQGTSLWDLTRGVKLPLPADFETLRLEMYGGALSGDGKWASAFAGKRPLDKTGDAPNDLDVYTWELDNPKNYHKLELSGLNTNNIPKLYFSPDNRFVIADISSDPRKRRDLTVWNINAGREVGRFSSDVHMPELLKDPEAPIGIYSRGRAMRLSRQMSYIPLSHSEAVNKIITFQNLAEGTVAQIRDISSNVRDIKTLPLGRYVDFIDFTGNGRQVITLSHNESTDKVLNIWDSETGANINTMCPFDEIIAVSATGNKLITASKNLSELELVTVGKNENRTISAYGDNDVLDYSARFSDDENYFVVVTTEKGSRLSREAGPYMASSFMTVWEVTPDSYFPTRILKIDNISRMRSFSRSNKKVAFVNDDGTVSIRRLIPSKAPLVGRIALPPFEADDSYRDIYPSKDRRTIVTVQSKYGSTEYEVRRWEVNWQEMSVT
jgi:WD40 repeat protein